MNSWLASTVSACTISDCLANKRLCAQQKITKRERALTGTKTKTGGGGGWHGGEAVAIVVTYLSPLVWSKLNISAIILTSVFENKLMKSYNSYIDMAKLLYLYYAQTQNSLACFDMRLPKAEKCPLAVISAHTDWWVKEQNQQCPTLYFPYI